MTYGIVSWYLVQHRESGEKHIVRVAKDGVVEESVAIAESDLPMTEDDLSGAVCDWTTAAEPWERYKQDYRILMSAG